MEAIFKSAGEKIYDLTHPDKKRIYLFSEVHLKFLRNNESHSYRCINTFFSYSSPSSQGSIYEKSLLGNKGANLCEVGLCFCLYTHQPVPSSYNPLTAGIRLFFSSRCTG